jgi:hypothetical protein
MRRALDMLTWLIVISAVSGVFCLTTTPDVEASLGIPACAGRPHNGRCRLCAARGSVTLPRVIDADNVRFLPAGAEDRQR